MATMLSELIRELETVQAEYGDLPVCVEGSKCYDYSFYRGLTVGCDVFTETRTEHEKDIYSNEELPEKYVSITG